MKRFFKRGFAGLACLLALGVAGGSQTSAPNPDQLLVRGQQMAFQEGPRAALPLFEQALPLFRARHDSHGEAVTLGYIGYCYEELSDYHRALDFLNQALILKRKLGDRREEGKTLNVIGLVYWGMANYPKATSNLNQSLQIAREVRDSQLEGSVLNNLGLISDEQGTYDRSLALYRRALEIDRAAHFDRGEAEVLGNLGGDDQLLGQFRESLKYYEQARDLDERQNRKPDLDIDLVDLGLCRLGLGQANEAIGEFEKALALARQIGLKKVEADARRDKGSALLQLGRYDAARQEYHLAIQAYEEAGLNQQLIEGLNDDGALHAQLGDTVSAEKDFRRAMELARTIGHPRGVITNLVALGDLEARRRHYDQAAAFYREAYEKARDAKDQSSMAASLLQLAMTLRDEGKLEEARAGAQQALAIGRATGAKPVQARAFHVLGEVDRRSSYAAEALNEYIAGEEIARKTGDSELEWRTAYGKGLALEALGRDREALPAYRQAVEIIEAVRSLLHEERFQAGYLQDKYQVYVSLVRLLLKMRKTGEAFLYSEKLRALNYRNIVHQELPARFKNEVELQFQIRQLQHTLDGERADPSSPPSRQASGLLFARLEQAERKYQVELDDLRGRDRSLAAVNGLSVASASRVRAHLPAHSALVEYLVGDDGVTGFVLTRTGVHAVTVPIESAQLRAKIELFRDLISRPGSDGWRMPAASLETLLIEPLEKPGWLKGVTRIYLVPNAILYYLPFAALPRTTGHGSHYLIEDYELSYLPAAVALAYGSTRHESGGSLIALAPAQSRLKYAQEEAQRVSASYAPRSLDLQGHAPTKAAFTRLAGRYQIIHLATHGFFDRLNPMFSGVQLEPEGQDDGRLEVYEILRLRLQARLVTLSACETALGSGYLSEFPAGDEFVGLTRAFLSAGSSSVLASLWEVDDRSTLIFMQNFYRNLHQVDARVALREAQLALLRSGGSYAHPYFWAPFVLVGAKN